MCVEMTRGTLVSSECPPLVLPTSWTIAAFSKNLSSYEWINYIGNIVTCKGWGTLFTLKIKMHWPPEYLHMWSCIFCEYIPTSWKLMLIEKRNRKVMQIENINAIFPHYCSFFIKLIQDFNHLSIYTKYYKQNRVYRLYK